MLKNLQFTKVNNIKIYINYHDFLLIKDKEWISNSNSEVPGKPIQLITQDSDGNFVVVKEALEILQGLHGNVAVCDVDNYSHVN